MSFVDTLIRFFARTPEETRGATPAGACPNCWGHMEYDGQVRAAARDRNVDLVNGRDRQTFVQQFVTEHIDGIRLRKGPSGATCPTCSVA